ncbi:hypothetical protein CPAR01_12243 [Colletotrichum paranaense]|uniref:Uncharacterized protein n=3 Tax=Colletotrichum acutatum species complex TaxID=2707335 RepID=A0AAI9V795_9PEZI|nr:uncharacterized protein CPAR01_12243 [Colletotrichum paranaense]KAK0375828.1 hypothetical protein CLIM01_06820 [Colletotrichum limetticola]KAK1470044.1 hypothetical protein CMEL01_01811 [Colletotrichum melonis]KAK1529931.1 hypothetical protein CPAR01_12243 [Colletotrichum paranaense]
MGLWGYGRDIRRTGLEPWNRLVDGMLDQVPKAGHGAMNCLRLQQTTATVDIPWRQGVKVRQPRCGQTACWM